MSFLADNLIPIFKKHELLFKESYQEAEGVHTLSRAVGLVRHYAVSFHASIAATD